MLVAVDVVILVMYTLVEGIRGNLYAKRIENTENLSEVKGVSTIVLTIYRLQLCCMLTPATTYHAPSLVLIYSANDKISKHLKTVH